MLRGMEEEAARNSGDSSLEESGRDETDRTHGSEEEGDGDEEATDEEATDSASESADHGDNPSEDEEVRECI